MGTVSPGAGLQRRWIVPIYDYKCTDCGRVWEVLQRGQGRDAPSCPACGASRAERLPSAAVVAKTAAATVRGGTCCGRDERCDRPPCASGDGCRRA